MPTAQEEFDAILAGAGMPAMSAAPPPMEGGNAQAEFDAILRRDRGEQFRAIEPLAQMQWVQDSVRQRAFRKGAGYDVPDADTFLTQMERDFEQEWVGSPHGFRPPPQRDMKVLALPSDAERKAPDFGAEATRLMRAYDMAQEFMATSDMGLAERGLKDVSSDLRPYVLHAIYDIAQHQGRQTPQEEGLRAGGRAFQRGGQEAVENFESFWREQVVPKYEGIPKGEVERDRFMRQARSARRGVEPLATSMVGIAVTDAISMSVRQVPGLAAAMAAGPHAGAAYWLTQEAPSMFDELVEGGVEPELAQPIALLAGALMAYTEMIEVNPLMPKGSGKVVGNYVARSTGQRIRQYGRRALIGLGKENLEEWLQGGEGLAAKWLASKMSKTAPDVDWVKELENTRRELARAFVSLPVMMGPGQMIGAVGGAVRARAAGLPWRAQLTAADIEAIAKLDTSTRTELAKALRVDRNELTKLFPQTATREGRAKLWGAAKYLMETEEQPNAVQEQAAQAQPVEAQPEVAGAAPQAEVADAAPTAAPGGTMAEAAAAADAAAEAPAEEGVRPHHLATAATPTQVTATQVTAASRLSLQHFDSLLADGKIDPEFHAAAKHILTELAPNMPAPTVLRLVNEVRRLTRTEADALGYGVPGQKMGGALTVPAKGMWRAIISLMAGDADATTVAHEWGHDWFRQLQAAALGGNTQAAELLEAYGRYHDAVGDELSMAPTSSDRIYNMSARMAEEMGVWLTGYDAARNRVGRARYNQGIIGKFMDAIQRLFRKIAIRLFGSVEAAARRVVDMGANEAGVRKAFGTDSVLARPARLVADFDFGVAEPELASRPEARPERLGLAVKPPPRPSAEAQAFAEQLRAEGRSLDDLSNEELLKLPHEVQVMAVRPRLDRFAAEIAQDISTWREWVMAGVKAGRYHRDTWGAREPYAEATGLHGKPIGDLARMVVRAAGNMSRNYKETIEPETLLNTAYEYAVDTLLQQPSALRTALKTVERPTETAVRTLLFGHAKVGARGLSPKMTAVHGAIQYVMRNWGRRALTHGMGGVDTPRVRTADLPRVEQLQPDTETGQPMEPTEVGVPAAEAEAGGVWEKLPSGRIAKFTIVEQAWHSIRRTSTAPFIGQARLPGDQAYEMLAEMVLGMLWRNAEITAAIEEANQVGRDPLKAVLASGDSHLQRIVADTWHVARHAAHAYAGSLFDVDVHGEKRRPDLSAWPTFTEAWKWAMARKDTSALTITMWRPQAGAYTPKPAELPLTHIGVWEKLEKVAGASRFGSTLVEYKQTEVPRGRGVSVVPGVRLATPQEKEAAGHGKEQDVEVACSVRVTPSGRIRITVYGTTVQGLPGEAGSTAWPPAATVRKAADRARYLILQARAPALFQEMKDHFEMLGMDPETEFMHFADGRQELLPVHLALGVRRFNETGRVPVVRPDVRTDVHDPDVWRRKVYEAKKKLRDQGLMEPELVPDEDIRAISPHGTWITPDGHLEHGSTHGESAVRLLRRPEEFRGAAVRIYLNMGGIRLMRDRGALGNTAHLSAEVNPGQAGRDSVQILARAIETLKPRGFTVFAGPLTTSMKGWAEAARWVRENLPMDQAQEASALDYARNRLFGTIFEPELEAGKPVPDPADEGEEQAPIEGRPDLANPAIDPNSRRFMDAVDEARKRLSQPVPRPDEIVQAAAQVRLSQDSEGEKQRLLEAANEGGQLGDVDTAVAKAILDREGVKAWESGDEEQLAQMLALGDAYRRTGTEQARAFRQRFDPVETPEQRRHRTMTEALFSPPQRGQKRLDRMHDKGDIEALRRERDRLTKQIAKLRKKLKLLGIDGETIKEAAKTRIGTAQVLGTIQAAKASVWDKLYEYWRNSILSAPTTQAANIIGNTGHMAWHYTAERFTEALVNTIWRRPDAAQLGEFKHILGGILPGLCRGAQNFVLSWKSELPFFEQSLGLAGTQKVEEPGVTIGGTTGRVVRSPQRLLLAADEFAKSLIWEMEVGAQAYRMAKAEGLSGQLLRQRIAELAADTTGEASQRAFDTAIDLTFQTRGGNVTKAILDARRKVPGLEYVVPFVTTPMNIFKLGVRKTPLGSLNLAWKALHGFRTGDWGGVSPKLVAEQLIAWAVVLVLMGNDEDDPWITGAAAEADAGSRQLARRTHPPMSVKVGGQWVSYSRIEPAATVLALTLDGIQAMKRNSGDALATFGGALDSLLGQVKDKTFLQGLGDLLAIVQGGRGGEEGRMNEALRYGSNFATSWVPNIVRSTGRSFDPYYPERGVWDKGPARRTRLLRRTLQSTELHLVQEQPAYDLWGRAVPRPGSPIPHTDWLWRMAVPINIKQEDIALGDRIIMAYNATAEQEKYPLVPSKRYVHRKVAHYMTDEQYAQFARESGQLAASLVEGQRWNLENVTEADMERLAKTIAKARQATKARLLGPEVHRDRQAAGGGWRLAGVRGQ